MAKGKQLQIKTELFPDKMTSTMINGADVGNANIDWIEETWAPLAIKYLRKDFDTFYDTVIRHTKNKMTREHLIEYKEEFVFTFLTLLTKDLILNTLYKQYKNNEEGLKMIYGMAFDRAIFLTNIAFAGLIGNLNYLDKLKLMDRKKYPDDLFKKADNIYNAHYELNNNKTNKMTYKRALKEAFQDFPELKYIADEENEFHKATLSYDKYREDTSR